MHITHLKSTADQVLSKPTSVAVPIGQPLAQTSFFTVDRADGVETGVWECTPGRWRRQVAEQEFCHFTHGRCTFTPDNGAAIAIQAGDALLFPENTQGIWDVTETLRKTYVIIRR